MKLFENKHVIQKLIIYFGVLLVVCIIGVVVTARYLNFQPNLPFGMTRTLQPVLPTQRSLPYKELEALIASNLPEKIIPSVKKAVLTDYKGLQFTIRGTFVEIPKYKNDLLTGIFVIADDPNKTRIPVFMTSKEGNISVGRCIQSLDGRCRWESENTTILESILEVNKPVELHIIVTSGFGIDMGTVFTSILTNEWLIPENFVIVPQMVGTIVEN